LKIVLAELEGITPFSFGKYYEVEKLAKELHPDYEKRTWRERCHYDKDGNCFIPASMFANGIKAAAKYLSVPIPGQSRSTFTKNYESGVMVMDNLTLPVKKDSIEGEWVLVPSDGRRGGTTRVAKCFPLIRSWKGVVTFYILDDIITKDSFEVILNGFGNLIGIGRFRPRNWGWYGRFKVVDLIWDAKK